MTRCTRFSYIHDTNLKENNTCLTIPLDIAGWGCSAIFNQIPRVSRDYFFLSCDYTQLDDAIVSVLLKRNQRTKEETVPGILGRDQRVTCK